ncbi:hypothetical protein N1I87_00455 [Bacillus sp. FSL W8-0102]|uniref:hypothetical protein n=1 Tax=Bacillus sp. FSL W8-0102 TaxID=2978205 RepID=UPI0030F9C565
MAAETVAYSSFSSRFLLKKYLRIFWTGDIFISVVAVKSRTIKDLSKKVLTLCEKSDNI